MSWVYQDEASMPYQLFMNNWSDWQWSTFLEWCGSAHTRAVRPWTQRHALKYWDKEFITHCWPLLLSFGAAHLISDRFNRLSEKGLECQGFIFTLAVIMPAPLCSCLRSRSHTRIRSAKCLLCVFVLGRGVWVCVWRRGRSGIRPPRLW